MAQYKTFLATAATAALVASVVTPAEAAVQFTDISNYSQSVQDEITSLADAGIINGTAATAFSPGRDITRGQVVKLLGRFLVKEGYAQVPTDWDKQQRFHDIRLDATDKDLIMNAAVVYDAGVFQGSNGNLISYQPISRENMALVLDRAAEKILGKTLVTLAQEGNKTGDVADLSKAKSEARAAIEAINALGISNVSSFNPKGNVTRANFVSFLHRAFIQTEKDVPVLTVKTAMATSPTALTVVLSDDATHNVVLDTPLEENKATDVTFTIDGIAYKATVTYVVDALNVTNVTVKNGTQIEVAFNHRVKELGNITVRGIDVNNASVTVTNTDVATDGKSVVLTVKEPLAGRYAVVVEDFQTADNVSNTPYDEIITVAADKTAPTIIGTERPYANRVLVKFSEPISTLGTVSLKLADGSAVVAAAEVIGNQDVVEFDLSSEAIPANAKVTASFVGTADVAGNLISPNPATVTFEKGAADGVAPAIGTVAQLGAKSFTLTLSEPVRTFTASNVTVSRATVDNAVTNVEKVSDTQYRITTADVLDGLNTIGVKNIEDLSGEKTASATTTATFAVDKAAPTVNETTIDVEQGHEYITIKFNKPVIVASDAKASVAGTYVKDAVTTTVATANVAVKAVDAQTVRMKLSDIAGAYTGAVYDISLAFSGIVSEADVAAQEVKNVTFTRGADTNENNEKVEVTNIQAVDNNTLEVTFSANVDAATATTVTNYAIDSATIEKVIVRADALNKAILTLQQDSIEQDGNRYISVSNVKASGSTVVMDAYRQTIMLTENVTPKVSKVEVLKDNQVKVTFSEAVKNISATTFVVAEGEKVFVGATTATAATEDVPFVTEATITLAKGDSFTAKSTITVTAEAADDIVDRHNNKLSFERTDVTVQ